MTGKLFILNGPNLNMLGVRQTGLYGTATLADIERECRRVGAETGFDEVFFGQTNAEHEIVEWVHEAFRQGAVVVVNPAAFSFGSIALLDALAMLTTPVVEVHITNIHARDELHRESIISTVARSVIAGAGAYGYELAIRTIARLTTT